MSSSIREEMLASNEYKRVRFNDSISNLRMLNAISARKNERASRSQKESSLAHQSHERRTELTFPEDPTPGVGG